jgi:hypothetical protein
VAAVEQAADDVVITDMTGKIQYVNPCVRQCEDEDMIPKDKSLDAEDDSEESLENQPLEWAEEDREMEDRKPDLGETEEDTSEL